jgi:hypothetical protein
VIAEDSASMLIHIHSLLASIQWRRLDISLPGPKCESHHKAPAGLFSLCHKTKKSLVEGPPSACVPEDK